MKRNLHFSLGLVLLIVLSGFTALAQVKLSGKVTDENNQPFPGVVVQQLNTQNKTATDANGNYAITLLAEGGKSLVFNYVGYTAVTVPYTGNAVLNAGMKPSASDLNEVIVVGYTSQRRGSISGAVGSVNMDNVDKRRVADVSQVLQGQVAGVQVTQSTGAPGDPIEIRIRGLGTIGDNSPLFIVDGNPTKDISFLNPADIKSLNVLKDAASAAVYGSRAAGGVIVITTKQGISGRSNLDLNYYNGIQKVTNLPTLLNSTQYLNKQEQAWRNAGYAGANPYTAEKLRTDLANTDWLDELFETGRSQSAQLTASGGSEKIQYLLAGGYYKQDGIVIYNNDQYKRLNFRVNINADVTDRFKVGTNMQLSYAKQDWLSSKGDAPGIIRHALLRPPVIPVFKSLSDPKYKASDPYTDLPFYTGNSNGWDPNFEKTSNPVALAYFANDRRDNFKTFGSAYAEYAFLGDKSLRLKSNLGIDLNFLHNKRFLQNFGDDDGGGGDLDKGKGMGRQNRPNGLNEERGEELNLTWTNTLNYVKTINKHAINALVGSELIRNSASAISASRARYDYTSGSFQYVDFGGITADLWNGGAASEWTLFSLFASGTYVYDSKYMLTANFRADASSRFGPNNQWGYFPSVSAGWVVSEEAFMKDVKWISNLKLRLSTGKLGNQQIPNYAYINTMRTNGDGYELARLGNPDFKWETTTQNNIGVDFSVLDNSLSVSADYFVKKTSGIIFPLSLPGFVGDLEPTYVNAGEVRNKGFELSLTYRNSIGDFKYNINGNLATLDNEILKLHPNLPALNGTVTKGIPGHALNSFYGYQMEGVYQTPEEVKGHLFGISTPTEVPGDIRFKDMDGNGIIDDKDRTFIGNPIPKLSYGFNLSGAYKGFDLSIFLQGVQGVDKYNDAKKITNFDTRPFNSSTAVLNSWTGPGTSNTMPRVSFNENGSSKISSLYIEDASYFRIKNIELGYSFGEAVSKLKLGIQDVRLYVSGQNLYTKTKYSGLDPESIDQIDMGTYPQSRAFLFGVNVKF
jgi:TonB-linked SusC/RagA family outer membrane protein